MIILEVAVCVAVELCCVTDNSTAAQAAASKIIIQLNEHLSITVSIKTEHYILYCGTAVFDCISNLINWQLSVYYIRCIVRFIDF